MILEVLRLFCVIFALYFYYKGLSHLYHENYVQAIAFFLAALATGTKTKE